MESLSVGPKLEGRKWKPEMMQHLIREHEKLGRTLTEEETVTLLRSSGFEISEPKWREFPDVLVSRIEAVFRSAWVFGDGLL
jgi:hypothetical protein